MNKCSQKDILEFLTKMAQQGTMPANTVNAQKAAVIKVLGVLDEKEQDEVTEDLDLEELIRRFQNKAKHELKGDSLRIYGTRFKSAFNAYFAWNRDPSNFKPKSKRGRPCKASSEKKTVSADNNTSKTLLAPMMSSHVNANLLVKYPLITDTIRGSLEIPETLSESDIDRLIPLVTGIIKAHRKSDFLLNEPKE